MGTGVSTVGLRTKFVVLFLLIAGLVILTGAIGVSSVSDVGASAGELENEGETRYGVVLIAAGFEQQHNAVRAELLGEDDARSEFEEGVDEVTEGFEILEEVELNSEEQALFDQLQSQEEEFETLYADFTAAMEAGDEERAAAIATEIDEHEDDIEDTVDEFAAAAEQDTQEAAAAVDSTIEQSLLLIGGMSVVAIVIAGGLGVGVSRHVGRPIRDLSESATAVARGNLTVDTEGTSRSDEVGELQNAFAEMEAYLSTVSSQAEALAEQDFDAAILQEDVPGELGAALQTMQADIETAFNDLETSRAEAEKARNEAQELADQLEDHAEQFGEAMTQAREGDLTQRLDEDIDNEAMALIAHEFNTMLAELEETIRRIRTFAGEVDAASERITASAEEVKTASEDVSQSIQQIAADADDQDQSIRQVADEMTNLSASIEEVAASTDEVAATTQQAAEIGSEGRKHARDAAEEMDAIEAKAEETVEEIEALDEEMEQISEVVELINEIAEQTNMLALNASIEAARAGDAGDGFGVVAEEIKALAEETSDATHEIESLISDVQTATNQAVEDMQVMGTRVTDGRATVDQAVSALTDIVQRVETANDSIQSINEAIDDQAASTEEVVAMADKVGEISKRTKAETDDVASAAEEQTATTASVTDDIQTLSKQATELREYMNTFDVSQDTERPPKAQ